MTDKTAGHTPRLILEETGNILHLDGRFLVEFDTDSDKIEEHAAIVRAVNSHDELLKALKSFSPHELSPDSNGQIVFRIPKAQWLMVKDVIDKAESK